MNVAFPLRDGYFRALQATPEDRQRWARRMAAHVAQSLEEEKPFFASNYEGIDTRQWKLVRRKDQLRVFRPRGGDGAAAPTATSVDGIGSSSAPCLLEIGTIEGTLEDVIYGVHNATTPDMRTTTSFLSADALDSAVLEVLENGCDGDLFRSFALKWRILETPAGSLVKNRDVCAFEYMGIATDDAGERFAFHVCDSFDHPVCPPFHARCIVRARTLTRIIYRQVRPGRVGVYYRAEYTTGGRIPSLLARWTAAEVAVSLGRSVQCAEAKKLTAIALAAHSSGEPRRRTSAVRGCSICEQPGQKALSACQVCGSFVCGKCRSRKYLLSDEGKIPVPCCKQCIVAAKIMRVDARQPLALVSATYWRAYSVVVSAGSHRPTGSSPQLSVFDYAVGSTRSAGVPVRPRPRPRSWTMGRDLSGSTSQRGERVPSVEQQKSREDVYDLLAALSPTSGSTVASMASRDETPTIVNDAFFERPSKADSDRTATEVAAPPPTPPSAPTSGDGELWLQIKQLRLAAEQTYRLTKQNSDEWVRPR